MKNEWTVLNQQNSDRVEVSSYMEVIPAFAWEQRKLGELTAEFTEYTTLSSELPLLTSSRAGLMYQNEY